MSSPLVFITGATGFIGSQVLDVTLRAGYRTRVGVRKQEQIEVVRNRYPDQAHNLEFVVVPDITTSNAFLDALRGVDFVFHLASPMPGKGEDLKTEYVDPAVKGTTAILEAANEHPTVKTVIIVSSVLALTPVNATRLPALTVKDNTNEVIPVDLDMEVASGPAGYGIKYTASKILAHQASRDFLKNKSPNFKLITFHPSYVLGPDLTQTSAETIGGINKLLWTSFGSDKPIIANVWVHIHDVAEAFIRAVQAGDSIKSGTEFLLSAPYFTYDTVLDHLKRDHSEVKVNWKSPFEYDWRLDTAVADELLGIQWKDEKVILDDLLDQQLRFQKANL